MENVVPYGLGIPGNKNRPTVMTCLGEAKSNEKAKHSCSSTSKNGQRGKEHRRRSIENSTKKLKGHKQQCEAARKKELQSIKSQTEGKWGRNLKFGSEWHTPCRFWGAPKSKKSVLLCSVFSAFASQWKIAKKQKKSVGWTVLVRPAKSM